MDLALSAKVRIISLAEFAWQCPGLGESRASTTDFCNVTKTWGSLPNKTGSVNCF